MKVTLSVIKADIGSIGGHIRPSAKLLATVRAKVADLGKGLLIDTYVGYTGDDVAILMTAAAMVLYARSEKAELRRKLDETLERFKGRRGTEELPSNRLDGGIQLQNSPLDAFARAGFNGSKAGWRRR